MGERDVDRIIEQWRAEARGAGESANGDRVAGPGPRLHGVLRRIGRLRLVAALVAAVVFAAVAVPVLGAVGQGRPVASEPTTAPAPEQPAAAVPEAPGAAVPEAAAGAAPAPTADASPAPSGEPSPLVDEWFAMMQAVDAARAAAYGAASPSGLERVFAVGSPAMVREQESIDALRAAGLRAVGWGTELLSVAVADRADGQAMLRVNDVRAAYGLVDGAGATTAVPAAPQSQWLVTLRRDGARWLVLDVVPDDPAAPVTSPPGRP